MSHEFHDALKVICKKNIKAYAISAILALSAIWPLPGIKLTIVKLRKLFDEIGPTPLSLLVIARLLYRYR